MSALSLESPEEVTNSFLFFLFFYVLFLFSYIIDKIFFLHLLHIEIILFFVVERLVERVFKVYAWEYMVSIIYS